MITSVQSTISQQIINSRFYQDCDAIGFSQREDFAVVVILHAKDGIIQGEVNYPLLHKGDNSSTYSTYKSNARMALRKKGEES